VAHRLEPVGEPGGVRYVNDSKATNVAAALRGLAAYADSPVHLILGGQGKGESFEPLVAAIGPNVRAVYASGETGAELADAVGDGDPSFYLKRQGIYAAFGVVAMIVVSRLGYRSLRKSAPSLLAVALLALLAVLAIGEKVNGARRWIVVGPATFQPSEFAKV